MDQAPLGQIPYKIRISAREREGYRMLFSSIALARGLTLSEDAFAYIVEALTVPSNFGLAYF